MKEITLNNGMVTLVDDADFEKLNKFNWQTHQRGKTWYAYMIVTVKGKRKNVFMHRLILNTPKGMDTHHVDGNGLNNQRSNLQAVTHAENIRRSFSSRTTTGDLMQSLFPAYHWDD